MKGVIFDRDGTLIKYKPYLHKSEDVELIEGVKECLEKLTRKGILIFLHTNQSGVYRGYFTLKDVEKVNDQMFKLMGLGVMPFKELCIATDLIVSNNSMRKPSPKFANYIMKKYNISNDNLFMVGDNISDVQTGISAKCNSILFASEWSIKSEISDISYNKFFKASAYKELTDIIINHFDR